MGLNALDVAVILAYLAAVTAFGLRFRSRDHTLRNYFLANRSAPWWAISLSIVAAETSTLTIVSIPGLAYDQDFRFLQLVLGYVLGRIVVSFLLIPQYLRGNLVTAYQLMERRFGTRMQAVTGTIFLVTRAAAEGVRVFAVAIVVRIALGGLLPGANGLLSDVCAIGIVVALTLVYTFEGGMAAVIWTDVVQLSVYIACTVVCGLTILHMLPGGWTTFLQVGREAGKFRIFDFSWSLSKTYTLWSGVIGGTFLTLASHGTDQLIVQRLLAARNEQQSKAALLSSGVFVLIQFSIFLTVGTLLFVLYRTVPMKTGFTRSDAIFPTFIVTELPHGMSGLFLGAILAAAMSNLSAALNALSSASVVDLYQRLRPSVTEQRSVLISRRATIVWAGVLFILAILSRGGGRVLEMGLAIASVAYGALLGAFFLGVLTKRATERGAILGMIAGFAFNLYLWAFTPTAFPWYVCFGSLVTFAVGYGASFALRETKQARV